MQLKAAALPACAVFLLSACATLPCTGNPATDSYSCARSSLKEGVYEQQLTDLRRQRAELRDERSRLARQNQTLALQLGALEKREAQALSRVQQANAELDAILAQLLAVQAEEREETQALMSMQQHAMALTHKQRRLTAKLLESSSPLTGDDAETLRLLEQDLNTLQREITRMSKN